MWGPFGIVSHSPRHHMHVTCYPAFLLGGGIRENPLFQSKSYFKTSNALSVPKHLKTRMDISIVTAGLRIHWPLT